MFSDPPARVSAKMRRLFSGSDTVERLAVEAERDQERLALTLVREFEHGGNGWFWQTDRDGLLIYLSDKVAAHVTPGTEGAAGRALTDLFHADHGQNERTLAFHMSSRSSFSELSVRTMGDAEDRWWSITGRPMVNELGHFQGFVGSGSDLTAKRQSEAEISKLALYDSLTGLPNRQRMKVALDGALAQGRSSYRTDALFLLDLDRFKAVNDTLGHQAGDALLQQVAKRLGRCVGETGIVGRLGGDEFKVLITGEGSPERLATLAADIIRALSEPYWIGGSSVTIGCSIGIAVAPGDGTDSDTLTRNADLALYAAKGDGRGLHRFYQPEMLAGAQGRKQMEDDLRLALAGKQLHVAYQPIVSTANARIVGYEALLRWTHPVRGAISPAEFIPVAEECGLIEVIGEWVLRTATRDASHWPDDIRVAVNLSPIQFANPALPALVTSALASSGIASERLELEITEGVFLNNSAATDRMFAQLKSLGLRLALDDFGTGYSSLGYLQTAPFDKIKIDQSFVRGAAIAGSRNVALIQAIVTLADALGMETTAEGVEVQDEIALIQRLGCSHIQGYVYSRPISAEQVLAQLGDGASATGNRTSRSPRVRVLRWAKVELEGVGNTVRIRNLSATGAMVDGIDTEAVGRGARLSIELADEKIVEATLQWARGGQAGLKFAEAINLQRLGFGTPAASIRPHPNVRRAAA